MKDYKKEVSIIIPCYNVEKYINRCLDSLKNQLTNTTYEIIVVNDASTDNTKKTIENRLREKDLNLVFINNEENIGAGASRNKAVNIAKYNYISLVDADDYLDNDFYDVMLNKIYEENLDLVVCDINMIFEEENTSQIKYGCDGKITKLNLVNTGFASSPCNKIIKRELLLKYPFAESIMNEDIPSIIAIILEAKKISYTQNTKYNYIQRSSSIQNTRLSYKRFDIFKSIEILENRIKHIEEFNDIMEAVIFQQLFLFYIYVFPKEKNFFRRTKFLRIFRKESKKYNLKDNLYIKKFIASKGKKASLFYKLIFNLNNNGFSMLTSLIMSLYNICRSIKHNNFFIKRFSVINKKVTMADLVTMARKQQCMNTRKNKISVIVPNYNYEKYLLERIYSILYQDYRIYELIILDDNSKDNSRKLIDDIIENLKEYVNIRKVYNKENSGSTFKQWEKGFELAKGNYVWIAEADDYCKNNIISSLMKKIDNDQDIVLGYVDTSFINSDGIKINKSIKPEIDIQKSGHWNKDFVNDGLDEIKNYAYLNCTIANVSSCIIKKGNYSDYLKESGDFKQAGDWLFYINVIKNGKILYINKPLNYYRVHNTNVSSVTKKAKHLEEIKKIHSIIKKEFNLNSSNQQKMNERIEFLKRVWNIE
ncbi:MAG: glycosyltransferase family 2 protein [Bacilli bacterium]|nr:glycosyltransferase family 2 protein [Bacilli bacterium]